MSADSRLYSTLHVKSVDTAQRVIEGVASTPAPDRAGDSMDPAGAEYRLPIPFLWFHDAQNPIGQVEAATVRRDGIYIRARVSKVDTPGRLKTLVDEAWAAFTATPPLVRGLSIGWKPLEIAPQSPGTKFQRITRWIWAELSAVTIPMNVDANILSVKSYDQLAPAASGIARGVIPSTPGASGQRNSPMNQTISEQIVAEQATLQAKSARLEELERDDETNGGLEEAEVTERTTLTTEVKTLTAKIGRLQALEAAQAVQAHAVLAAVPHRPASTQRIEVVDHVKALPKGTLFARYAMAVAAGKGSMSDTLAYAKRWDSQTPEVTRYIKAIEGTSVVGSPAWGGELVFQNNLASEFVELLMAATIIGRVNGFRPAPFNVRIPVQSGGSTVNWVGEAAPKPVTELAFTTLTIPYNKIAGIVVLTEELVRLSSPSAEATVRNDLTEQIARFIDRQFIQVAIAAGANNPASITNGVVSPAASGTTLDALLADLNTALGTFDTAGIPTDGLVVVTTPAVARGISMLTNALGQAPNNFGVTPTGGTLLGYPVIVSSSVDAGTIVIFKPSEIFLADDGRVTLDASNQATLDMDAGSPTTPTFNLWQRNCVGIRAERWITWVKRRADAVAVIDTAAYGPSVGSP